MAIDFALVDMRDVDGLAWVIDNIEEPDYSKALAIIRNNGDFEDFKIMYFANNGIEFVERKTIQIKTVFTKTYDEDMPWTGLHGKELDDTPPSCCVVEKNNTSDRAPPTNFNLQSFTVKELDYLESIFDNFDISFDVARNDKAALSSDRTNKDSMILANPEHFENDPSEEMDIETLHNSGRIDISVNKLVRLERDFPQKVKKIKRITRWAPVLLKRPTKVGEYKTRSENISDNDPNEQLNVKLMEKDDFDMINKLASTSNEQTDKPNVSVVDSNVSTFNSISLKRRKLDNKYVCVETKFENVPMLMIEANYNVKKFDGLEYCQHHRVGRFHFLSNCQDERKFIHYLNIFRNALIDDAYIFDE